MNDQRRVEGCRHHELAIGWALHSLEPAEESLAAAHLPDCPTCTEMAAQTEEACAMLGLSVPEEIPSAGLKQRILGVTGNRWMATAARPSVPLASSTALAPPTPPTGYTAKSWWFLPPVRLAAAAAVILVAAAVALGARVAQLGGQLDQAQREATVLSETIRSAADPAAARVPLVAKDGQPVGMVLASRDQVAVVPTRLPSNRMADQIYVLWGLAGDTPIALGVFDVSGEMPGLHAVTSAAKMGRFTAYAISLEPGRRAPAVPTDVVASGMVTS